MSIVSLANSFSHDLLLLAYFITSQFLAASIPYYHASSLATCYISFLIIPSHPVASPLTLFLGFLLLHWFSLSFPLATWCVYHVTNPFLLAATLLILSTLLQLLSNQPCCWHDFRLLGIRTNCWSDKRTQWSILVGSILVSTAYQTVSWHCWTPLAMIMDFAVSMCLSDILANLLWHNLLCILSPQQHTQVINGNLWLSNNS